LATQRKSTSTPKKRTTSRTTGNQARGGKLRAFAAKIGGVGPWWAKTLRWLAFLSVSGILVGALAFFLLYRMIEIPNPNQEFQTQTTQVYYSDGKHKIGEFARQDRESIPITEIPASMQAAAIAAEDRTFYTNRGIDIRGIIRAARDNTTSGEIQGGGSTITQQYVKILYLTQERSYTRKVKEAILSIKIHNQLTKKDILEGYLNTIYFGNGAYGIEVASQTYFDKPASELNYAQSAFLATVINSPSYYDPYTEGGEERILPRYNYVLNGMVKSGAITAEEGAKFQDKLPKMADKKDNNRFSGSKGYLLDLVKNKMRELEFTDSQIDGGGLKITTTFDYGKQKDAVAAVKQVRPDGLDELHAALVSVEPGSGAVRAMYGGRDFLKSQLNWTTERTQPGSTFKAFAVVAALQDGYSLRTTLNGSSPLRIGDAEIENQGDSGGASFGRVPLSFATEKSVNTAFVDLVDQMSGGGDVSIGAEKVLRAATDLGIPEKVTRDIEPVLATPLGYAPVAPIDMANAYATLAAGGERADWYVIEKVVDDRGEVEHQHEKKTERGVDEDVAADTVAAMQGVVTRGTGTSGRTICPTAGKTGTATAGEGDDSRVSSSWFAGFTPKLATAVMYNRGNGNEELEGYLQPFYGGTYPAQTFKAYMDRALEGEECGEFAPPANIRSDKGTVYRTPAAPTPKKTSKPKPKPEPTTESPKPEPEEPSEPEPEDPPTDDDGSDDDGPVFPRPNQTPR
jgi:membrane peptidoglycan carboxypeptidase